MVGHTTSLKCLTALHKVPFNICMQCASLSTKSSVNHNIAAQTYDCIKSSNVHIGRMLGWMHGYNTRQPIKKLKKSL